MTTSITTQSDFPKVGLVGPLPPPFGGMANQLNQLKSLLDKEGVSVFVVQNNAPYGNKLIAKIKGVRAAFRLFPFLYQVWKLAGKVDVIHVFANSGWSWQLFSAPVLWLAAFRNTPVIVNYRGGEAKTYFQQSIRFVRPSMNLAHCIVVPSGYLQQIFAEFGLKTEIIPNIIDLNRFKSKKHPLRYHVVITRNLEPIYGIETAIDAISIVKQKIPQVRLTIAGSGPQENELKQKVEELNLKDNVGFSGKLSPDQVADLYRQADIMLNPTTVDNMPNSVLEAMASGVPVVSTNVGGVPYIVKDRQTALLVKAKDPVMMAENIIELFNDQALYRQLAENGLEEVKKYSWSRVKKQWLTLYRTSCEEK